MPKKSVLFWLAPLLILPVFFIITIASEMPLFRGIDENDKKNEVKRGENGLVVDWYGAILGWHGAKMSKKGAVFQNFSTDIRGSSFRDRGVFQQDEGSLKRGKQDRKIDNKGAKKEMPEMKNRLASETSLYLLQHAHNPIDWYPWSEEAFRKAKAEKKLIFLSVGYSSCHWCHVMEKEVFVDEEIAAYLNEHYVCIKVDREERPDVDDLYMRSVQIYNRIVYGKNSGGWPMSVFLTPDGKPFYGGSYIPARDGDRAGMTGFLTLINHFQKFWTDEAESIEKDASLLAGAVQEELENLTKVQAIDISKALPAKVLGGLEKKFDPDHGGFGFHPGNPEIPKFPEPSNLAFLIRYRDFLENEAGSEKKIITQVESYIKVTLDSMAKGGIRDHLGGGFHRYSVDRFWHIPHFEKMLYDNGQLLSVYAKAYEFSGDENYKVVGEELADFILREMQNPSGGFYAAYDADSEGEEGTFYRWEKEEVKEILSEEEFHAFSQRYGLEELPNFEGKYYVPRLQNLSVEDDLKESKQLLASSRQKLYEARARREKPALDTKIIASWNGLMIEGLAKAGVAFEREDYLNAAEKGAEFILSKMRNSKGLLCRIYHEKEGSGEGFLNDYAFVVAALLALHEATGEERWLKTAADLAYVQADRFEDPTDGSYYFSSSGHEELFAKIKDPIDGALPAGSSVTACNLVTLGKRLKDERTVEKGKKLIESTAFLYERAPVALPKMSIALLDWLEYSADLNE
ncbi:MAG: thioredoxin domain-containing protein [Pirellulaceae bacterium]|nr:thioredoxin domain-containing protein [Pirellulaceae bacterium]